MAKKKKTKKKTKKTKAEKQMTEDKERRRRCNIDGDKDNWSNADQLCYVLTRGFPLKEKKIPK